MSEASKQFNELYEEVSRSVRDKIIERAAARNVRRAIDDYAVVIKHFDFVQRLPRVIQELQEGYTNAQKLLPAIKSLCKEYRHKIVEAIGSTTVIPSNVQPGANIQDFIARGSLHDTLSDFPELENELSDKLSRLNALRTKMEEEYAEEQAAKRKGAEEAGKQKAPPEGQIEETAEEI